LPTNEAKTVCTICTHSIHSEFVIRLAHLFEELYHLILSDLTYLVVPKRDQSPFVNNNFFLFDILPSNVKAKMTWPSYMVFPLKFLVKFLMNPKAASHFGHYQPSSFLLLNICLIHCTKAGEPYCSGFLNITVQS
jgi:hypothetical protein